MIADLLFRNRRQRQFSLDATRTNRINEDHWADAEDEPINVLLGTELSTLRARARHEFLNNPIVKGVVKTYRDDIVGPHGPALTVQTDDDNYNSALEQVWHEWWARPDLNGVHSGVDLLGLSMLDVFQAGDYLWQIVVDDDAPGPVKSRVLMIHPRRLTTPYDMVGDDAVTLGIRRSETGKPLMYYVEGAPRGDGLQRYSLEYAKVPAADMIHGFEHLESDQVRGMPWLSTCLPVIADLRDYDQQVLDAARMAAAMSVLLFTKHADVNLQVVNETTEMQRQTMSTLPPGYEAMQITPQQPSQSYREFKDSRTREIGRPFGMGLLTINQDARGHSWSSARLDRDVYHKALGVQQGDTNRTGLNRLLDVVKREAELALLIAPRDDARYVWTWQPFTSIDPLKESKAATERLKNITSTHANECAALGLDYEEVIKQRGKELDLLRAAGLLPARRESRKPNDVETGPTT